MSFIPTNFGEIVVTYSQAGTIRPAQWTIGVSPGVTDDPSEYLDDIIASWKSAGNVLNVGEFDSRLTCINVRLTMMTNTGPIIYDRPQNLVGTRTGDAQPPNVAALIRRITARGGRRGRGRLYLPSAYMSEVDVLEGGILSSAHLTDLQSMANNIYIACRSVNGAEPVLLHNDDVVPPDDITGMTVQSMVATMRRRLRK